MTRYLDEDERKAELVRLKREEAEGPADGVCGFRWRETPQPDEAPNWPERDPYLIWRECTLPWGHDEIPHEYET